MTRMRVACIGSGFIAGRHLAALGSFDDVEVVAVADTVPDRAEAAAAAFGARAYGDGLDLLREEELDAVWICVPPFAHGPLEELAVARGVPLFVEKPLACDLPTAERIAALVRSTGTLAAVGYHWRYLSLVEEVRELLRDRPPAVVTGYWLDCTPAAPWWIDRASSGGQMVEQATHLLDLARLLVGEVSAVRAVEVPAGPDAGPATMVPMAASATLSFTAGAIGTVTSARFLHARHRVALHLLGEGYAIELSERSLTDHELLVSTTDGTRVCASDEDPIRREDRAFLDAVTGRGHDVRAPYAEALRSHRLAATAERSAQDGGTLLSIGDDDA